MCRTTHSTTSMMLAKSASTIKLFLLTSVLLHVTTATCSSNLFTLIYQTQRQECSMVKELNPVDMCCKILLYQSNRIIPICNTYGLGKGQRYFIIILHCLLEVYIVFSLIISLLLEWLQDCVLFKKVHAQLWKNQRWSEMETNWGLLQTPYQTNW